MSITAGKVVIIGAGEVGSTCAFALQMRGAAREIVLIDMNRERAEGQAQDLAHGQSFTPPVTVRAGDYSDCGGAEVIIVTAGAAQKPGQSRLDLVGTNVEICRSIVSQIVTQTREAVLVVVTNPVDVLTYAAIRFSDLPRGRVIGSGTVLDTARFRFFLSQHCHVDPSSIHGYVLGEHGDSEVVAWSITTLAGMRMEDYCRACPQKCPPLDREKIATQVRHSAYHVIEAKGATNFAVALALLRITTAIIRGENSALTVSTLLQGEYGLTDVCLSVPTIVNRNGADRLVCPELSPEDLNALKASAEAIRSVQRSVGLT
jgi:L-lactate dehydrogenase